MEIQMLALLIYVLLVSGYVLLDGFDLGAGVIYFLCKNESSKKATIKAIAHPWDGNEVWLVSGVFILFIGSPKVCFFFFDVFMPFWTTIVVSLFLKGLVHILIDRVHIKSMQRFCSFILSSACLLTAVSLGIIMGHLSMGLPVGKDGSIVSNNFKLFSAVPALYGLIFLLMFVKHGAYFLAYSSSGNVVEWFSMIATRSSYAGMFLYLFCSLYFYLFYDFCYYTVNKWVFLSTSVLFFLSAAVPTWLLGNRKFRLAFIASYFSIILPMVFAFLHGVSYLSYI